MTAMFFDGWWPILRVVVIGPLAYVALVALLRASGKRTLAKLNAFDLVVTVALGSTFATVLLSKSVPLLDGVTALATLVGLQFGVAWLSVRSQAISGFVKSEPTLLLRGGEFLDAALRRQRVTRDEVRAALRNSGVPDGGRASAVILETDGSLSVIKDEAPVPASLA